MVAGGGALTNVSRRVDPKTCARFRAQGRDSWCAFHPQPLLCPIHGANPRNLHIDVREPGELKSTGHIPHAINIPVTSAPDSFHIADEEFEDRFGFPRPARDEEVVFYCKAGVRSRAAAGLAKDAGWSKVGEYPGSWMDWAGKGGKIER